jgi:hypothetical protein
MVRNLHWWPEHRLLLVGCDDEKVIAFDEKGQRKWEFTSQIDPAVLRTGKDYWFERAPGQHGIHGLYTGTFLEGKSQAFVGSACTIEILDEHGHLVRRLPALWGLPSVFTVIEHPDGRLALLAGRKNNGHNTVAVVDSRSVTVTSESFDSVPETATYVDGWASMNRHHLCYEDMAGDGHKVVVGDISGSYNRITLWETGGRALYDAAFGPGPSYGGGSQLRRDTYDNRNVRDMSIADLDGDGKKEVVVGLWSGYVLVLDHQLHRVWSVSMPDTPSVLRAVPAPSGAGCRIVVASENGTVTALDSEGVVLRTDKVEGLPTFIDSYTGSDGSSLVVIGTRRGYVQAFRLE